MLYAGAGVHSDRVACDHNRRLLRNVTSRQARSRIPRGVFSVGKNVNACAPARIDLALFARSRAVLTGCLRRRRARDLSFGSSH